MKQVRYLKLGRRQWIFVILIFVALYVLLPQTGLLKQSIHVLRSVNLVLLVVAACFSIVTYPVAAITYCLLARKKLNFPRTVLVQFASMFANRLLPAGIGGIGANYAYLRKAKHNRDQATAVVAVNNALGVVAHLILLGITLLLFHAHLESLELPSVDAKLTTLDRLVVIGFLLALGFAWHYRRSILARIRVIFRLIAGYRQHPLRLGLALLTSATLTLCNVLSLYFCALSLHVSISLIAVLLIFTLGIALGTSTPTPGGLGGVEAGLLAGLVAFHITPANALAVVLAYRLITYWFALGTGALAMIVAERRGYF